MFLSFKRLAKTYLMVSLSALFLFGSLVSCSKKSQGLQIKGSDTEVNMVSRMAEVYQKKHPDRHISVTGGGSGTGVAALINGNVDIANASREMKEEEIKRAKEAGLNPIPVVIAMDGLSVIVHPDNGVSKLTLPQIGDIYTGKIKNWKEVGGEDRQITLYGRQSNSGTFVFFRDNVLGTDYSQEMNRMNGNAQIVKSVKADKSGIGYVGVGYITEDGEINQPVNVVKVAKEKGKPYGSPMNPDAVKKGTYPLARPLFQWVDKSSYQKNRMMREFIAFELSEAGQEIAVNEGFYPVSKMYRKQNEKHGFVPGETEETARK